MDVRDYPEAYIEQELDAYGTRNHLLDKAAAKIKSLREQLKEAERQRDELLAVLEDVRKCKSLYSMWRGRNKSKTYGAIIDAAIAAARKEQK